MMFITILYWFSYQDIYSISYYFLVYKLVRFINVYNEYSYQARTWITVTNKNIYVSNVLSASSWHVNVNEEQALTISLKSKNTSTIGRFNMEWNKLQK